MGWFSSVAASLTVAVLLAGCPDEKLGGYPRPLPDGARFRDPVSGRECTKDGSTEAAVFRMRTFYFCSDEARAEFSENPEEHAFQ